MFRIIILIVYSFFMMSYGSSSEAVGLVVGDWDYCSSSNPCNAGEGDCDSDLDCVAGLKCVKNVGPEYNFAKGVDVCEGTPSHPNNQSNQSTGGNNDNPDWAGGGVPPGTNPGTSNSSGSGGSSISGIDCSNPFQAALHPEVCSGVGSNNSGYGSPNDGRSTGSVCGTRLNPGDAYYCWNCGPCNEGEGICTKHSQCKSGLVCSSAGICVKP